jgi:hypothetical protein
MLPRAHRTVFVRCNATSLDFQTSKSKRVNFYRNFRDRHHGSYSVTNTMIAMQQQAWKIHCITLTKCTAVSRIGSSLKINSKKLSSVTAIKASHKISINKSSSIIINQSLSISQSIKNRVNNYCLFDFDWRQWDS